MTRKIKQGFKWAFIGFALLVVLFLVDLTALAFPQALFDDRVRYGNLVFYSDRVIDPPLDAVLRGVQIRVAATELYDPDVVERVFVCTKQSTYSIIRRLALVPARVPGFNLSFLNNSFVSVPLLNQRRDTNWAGVVYSTLSGDIGHSIAHELIHDYAVAHQGFLAVRSLPRWKTEGYAEYAASIAMIRTDSTATLASRIDLLQSNFRDARPYNYYRWTLVVEYLSEYEDLSYDEIMDERVTLEAAYRRMMDWRPGVTD